MQKQTFALTRDQKIALSVLIQYRKATSKAGRFEGVASGQLKSFMQRLTDVDDLEVLYGKCREEFANDVAYAKARPFVREAISVAFSYQPRGRAASNGAITDVLTKLASVHERKLSRFNQIVPGVYACYRYAAHNLKETSENRAATRKAAGASPEIIKAAFEIVSPAEDGKDPTFELRYRPGPKGKIEANTGTGNVVLLDGAKHLLLFGEDERSGYPLYILANYNPQSMKMFNALVVRLHETGQAFASRCCFVKTTKKLTALEEEIGIYQESDLEISGEIAEIRDLIANIVHHPDGKAALHIHF